MKGFAKNTTSPNSVQQGWLAVKVKPELQRLLLENGCFRQDGLSHSLLPTLQLHGLVSLCVQNANGVLLCELPRWLLGCDGLGPEHGDYGGLNVLHTLQEDGHRWRCGPKREGLLPLVCACTSVNMCVCARVCVCAPPKGRPQLPPRGGPPLYAHPRQRVRLQIWFPSSPNRQQGWGRLSGILIVLLHVAGLHECGGRREQPGAMWGMRGSRRSGAPWALGLCWGGG
jgi:hypothetical protein